MMVMLVVMKVVMVRMGILGKWRGRCGGGDGGGISW